MPRAGEPPALRQQPHGRRLAIHFRTYRRSLTLSALSFRNLLVASSITLLKSTGGSPAFCGPGFGCLNPNSFGLSRDHRAWRVGTAEPSAGAGLAGSGTHGS